MAQQAPSAREPSMEEILASIRRIIEDNELPRREPDALDIAIGPAANDPAPKAKLEADAAEETSIEAEAPDMPETAEALPEIELGEIAIDEPAAEPSAANETATATAPVEKEASAEQGRHATQWDSAFLKSLDDKAEAAPSAFQRTISTPRGAAEPASPIMSEQSGRQVAASFGELSDAFAASRRRSFDKIAAEMMRPMLQDWLDNNLPPLVERLVRDEIERVAREI